MRPQHHLGAFVLLVVEHPIAVGRLLKGQAVADQVGSVDLSVQNHPQQVGQVFLHMGLARLDRSRWVIAGPMGRDVELMSEVVEDRPGELIAWRGLEGSDVDHEGRVEFRDNPFGRGTEVRVFVSYDPPAGALGKIVAKISQKEPRIQARRDLRRFKQLMETGEIPTSQAPDAAPRGKFL